MRKESIYSSGFAKENLFVPYTGGGGEEEEVWAPGGAESARGAVLGYLWKPRADPAWPSRREAPGPPNPVRGRGHHAEAAAATVPAAKLWPFLAVADGGRSRFPLRCRGGSRPNLLLSGGRKETRPRRAVGGGRAGALDWASPGRSRGVSRFRPLGRAGLTPGGPGEEMGLAGQMRRCRPETTGHALLALPAARSPTTGIQALGLGWAGGGLRPQTLIYLFISVFKDRVRVFTTEAADWWLSCSAS